MCWFTHNPFSQIVHDIIKTFDFVTLCVFICLLRLSLLVVFKHMEHDFCKCLSPSDLECGMILLEVETSCSGDCEPFCFEDVRFFSLLLPSIDVQNKSYAL